jgi:hypothetical protein
MRTVAPVAASADPVQDGAVMQDRGRRPQILGFVAVMAAAVVAIASTAGPMGDGPSGTVRRPTTALDAATTAPVTSTGSVDSAPPAAPAAPATPAAPAAAGTSAIMPGEVNRTSIKLEATYEADVYLGFNERSLVVDVKITVTNRSGAGIDRVELNTITGPLGNLRLKVVRVDGVDADANVDDQTIRVQLGGVLPDDATALVRVRIRASIPSTLGGSNWMFTRVGGILQANRWIPWVGLHRPFDRPNHGDPFFTALSPHVTVRITTDRKLRIATPGRRVDVDGLTQTFEAENVRDFPIVASPNFEVRKRTVGGRTLRAYRLDGFPTGKILDWMADGLDRMGELAGEYPSDRFTVAQTAGGYALEGPGLIWIPTGLAGSQLKWNVYHETAHQWLYWIVGSDHARDPFADEAVATHLGQVASGIWRNTGCPMKRLDLSIYRYSEACYFGQIYLHGADLLQRVRRDMDAGEYWDGVRDYVADHHFGIGSTMKLLAALQSATSLNLEPILAPWFPSLY